MADPRGGVRHVLPGRGNDLHPAAEPYVLIDGQNRVLRDDLLRCLRDRRFARVDLLVSFVMKSGLEQGVVPEPAPLAAQSGQKDDGDVQILMMGTGWHAQSRADWRATAEQPVHFEKHRGELTHEQLGWLRTAFPDGSARFWAASNILPEPGDCAWFHRDGAVFAIAPILASFRNGTLATALWPNPHYASERTGDWGQVFAFHKPAPAMISKRMINKILGHREGDRWQNPRLLTESESQKLSGRLI